MAIAQERMIALLNAAKDYQRALAQVEDRANALATAVKMKQISLEDAFNALVIFTSPRGLLGDEAETRQVIAEESVYWRYAEKRNIRERERLQRRRAEIGLPVKSGRTAPKRLSTVHQAPGKTMEQQAEELLARERASSPADAVAAADNAELDFDEGDLGQMAEALPTQAKESVDEFLKKHGA